MTVVNAFQTERAIMPDPSSGIIFRIVHEAMPEYRISGNLPGSWGAA